MTAAYLINRTPFSILQHKTLYEVVHDYPTDYSMIWVFDCLGFTSILTKHRNKFQSRAKLCVFLGYPSGVTGYKVLNVSTKQIFISRDIVFHEEIFPFQIIVETNEILDHFPDIVLPSPRHLSLLIYLPRQNMFSLILTYRMMFTLLPRQVPCLHLTTFSLISHSYYT